MTKKKTTPEIETTPTSLGQQQELDDKPFQQSLSAMLQAQDKARAKQVQASQERQSALRRKAEALQHERKK